MLRKITASSLWAAGLAHRPGKQQFSVLFRPAPNYPNHIPLNAAERVFLAVGSAIGCFVNPRRGDLIAQCGEATAVPFFIYRLRDSMLADPSGRRILRDRPRITSVTLNLNRMRKLPANSVGREYVAWLDKEGVSPDTRPAVRYINEPECAYVMQRYRESHDFYHALTGLPIVREGEIALKAFEFANTQLPMTGLSIGSTLTVNTEQRKRLIDVYIPWAFRNGLQSKEVINIYWEEEMETDVDVLRKRIGLEKPPDLRKIRAEARDRKRKSRTFASE